MFEPIKDIELFNLKSQGLRDQCIARAMHTNDTLFNDLAEYIRINTLLLTKMDKKINQLDRGSECKQ